MLADVVRCELARIDEASASDVHALHVGWQKLAIGVKSVSDEVVDRTDTCLVSAAESHLTA